MSKLGSRVAWWHCAAIHTTPLELDDTRFLGTSSARLFMSHLFFLHILRRFGDCPSSTRCKLDQGYPSDIFVCCQFRGSTAHISFLRCFARSIKLSCLASGDICLINSSEPRSVLGPEACTPASSEFFGGEAEYSTTLLKAGALCLASFAKETST